MVGKNDSAILERTGRFVELGTAQGEARAEKVLLQTPLGRVYGLSCEGSPRLFPWIALPRAGLKLDLSDTHVATITGNGRQVKCRIVGGTPVLTEDCGSLIPHCKAAWAKARGRKPRQKRPTEEVAEVGDNPPEDKAEAGCLEGSGESKQGPVTAGGKNQGPDRAGPIVGRDFEEEFTSTPFSVPKLDVEGGCPDETSNKDNPDEGWSEDPARQLVFKAEQSNKKPRPVGPGTRNGAKIEGEASSARRGEQNYVPTSTTVEQAPVGCASPERATKPAGRAAPKPTVPCTRAGASDTGPQKPTPPGPYRPSVPTVLGCDPPETATNLFVHSFVQGNEPSNEGSSTPGLAALGARQRLPKSPEVSKEHAASHYPLDSECLGCILGRCTRTAHYRGAAKLTLQEAIGDGESVIHFDLRTGMCPAEHTKHTNLFVARAFGPDEIIIEGSAQDEPYIEDLVAEEFERNPKRLRLYAGSTKTRETPCLMREAHRAREYFGLTARPTVFHTDRETALWASTSWEEYTASSAARTIYGIPHESNTNATAESAVRLVAELGAATLVTSGLRDSFWLYSCRTAVMNLRVQGVNTVTRQRFTGQHGVIAASLDRAQRGSYVTFLAYDVQSSGGVLVLIQDANDEQRLLIVADRHIRWFDEFTFKRQRVGLTDTKMVRNGDLASLPPCGRAALNTPRVGPVDPTNAPLRPSERRVATDDPVASIAWSTARDLLSRLRAWDTNEVFIGHPTAGEPPAIQALYLEAIENPLWVERLEGKLQNRRYRTVDDLWRDCKIMARNAWTFNEINSRYWRAGKELSCWLDRQKRSYAGKLDLQLGGLRIQPQQPILDLRAARVARLSRRRQKRHRQKLRAREEFNAERRSWWRPPAGNRSTRHVRQKQLRGLVARLGCMLTQQLKEELLESAQPDATLPPDFVPPRALLTRKCTKSEAASEAGQFAAKDELRKVCLLQGIAEPILETEAAKEPDATVSSVCMLQSIKHAERQAAQQKHKGRLVLLGDKITALLTGRPVTPTGEQYGLSGELTSLDGVRVVLAHHLMLKAKGDVTAALEKADITSAYLQAPWPAHIPPHFLRLPSEVWRGLPDDLRAKADALRSKGRVCFRMRTCLYGHPVSGHAWISKCDLHLKATGWTPVEGVPAVYQRKGCLIAVYVDDVIASGPKTEIDQFWSELQDKFGSGASASNLTFEPEVAKEFLGADFEIIEKDDSFELSISMKDYAREIWETYERTRDDTNVRINNATVPIADELSTPTDSGGGHTGCDGTLPAGPSRRVQKLIGMVLWIARNSRPDAALAVSRLGTQVHRWSLRSERELQRLCKYLYETRGFGTCMRMPKGARPEDLELVTYSDANLGEPTSQSGVFLALMGRAGTASEGAFCPLTWRSKRQPLTLDSSGATEMVAAHYAVRELLECVHSLTRTLGLARGDPPMKLMVDNSTVLRNSRRGDSPSLGYLRLTARLRLGMLKDLQDLRLLQVEYVKSADNLADAFTKVLGRVAFERARLSIGVKRVN